MREYRAHETHRMQELDGIALADFWQRAAAFLVDLVFALAVFLLLLSVWDFAKWVIQTGANRLLERKYELEFEEQAHTVILDLLVPIVYFGLSTFLWNGQTMGKRLFGIRVVSLVHARMSLWHSVERALGYAAAALEFGFGFAQFFIHPYRRTIEDRIGETIVVKESAFRARFNSDGTAKSSRTCTSSGPRPESAHAGQQSPENERRRRKASP